MKKRSYMRIFRRLPIMMLGSRLLLSETTHMITSFRLLYAFLVALLLKCGTSSSSFKLSLINSLLVHCCRLALVRVTLSDDHGSARLDSFCHLQDIRAVN